MSEWLLGSNILTQIRDYLVHDDMNQNHVPMAKAVAKADKLVKSFNKMNCYAIGCRYGSKIKAAKIGCFDVENHHVSIYQMFKHMECLGYHCSEGDTEKKHAKTWKAKEEIANRLARQIAFSHPSVKSASWN